MKKKKTTKTKTTVGYTGMQFDGYPFFDDRLLLHWYRDLRGLLHGIYLGVWWIGIMLFIGFWL